MIENLGSIGKEPKVPTPSQKLTRLQEQIDLLAKTAKYSENVAKDTCSRIYRIVGPQETGSCDRNDNPEINNCDVDTIYNLSRQIQNNLDIIFNEIMRL
jgi:hypothetical protein